VNFGMGKAQIPRLNCCFPRRVALTYIRCKHKIVVVLATYVPLMIQSC
jgi:hypothetical protein